MELITLGSYTRFRNDWATTNTSIGFVPTMGALHEGHLKLVDRASTENDKVIVTIFVNPTQFNNSKDFQVYPRVLERDLDLLKSYKNVFVIHPSREEIYPVTDQFTPMPLGFLGEIMEGRFRPGHFEGVVHVVHNLFNLIKPNRAYFGMKDFQQLTIIRKLVDFYQFDIEIVSCETIRSKYGLALSSRNARLDDAGLKNALGIFRAFEFIRSQKGNRTIDILISESKANLEKNGLEVEYLEIRDFESLELSHNLSKSSICFIAAYCQGVRLIDNMLI